MSFKLKEIVPWGRSLDEYVHMFALSGEDFPQGRIEGRYLPQSAPVLSFPDGSFDLALSSHFLFLYSDHLDLILFCFRRAARVGLLVFVDGWPCPGVDRALATGLRRGGF